MSKLVEYLKSKQAKSKMNLHEFSKDVGIEYGVMTKLLSSKRKFSSKHLIIIAVRFKQKIESIVKLNGAM